MIATVGVLRLATSSSVSASLMLLLSCPSLKSTISRRRPGSIGRGERDRQAVEDGAAAAAAQRRERLIDVRRRLGEVDQPADAHVEGEEPQPVARRPRSVRTWRSARRSSSSTGPVTLALTSSSRVTSIGSFS